MVSGIGSGLGGQFGMVAGATYGTAVTVTRFLEIDSETFTRETQRVMSKGIGRGSYQRSDRVKGYVKGGGGDIVIPWTTKGMGLPLKMALGADTVTTPGGATLERQHLIAPSTAGLFGLFFTAQFGKPSIDGTINPYTYPSCKVTAWEISCGKDGYLTLKLTCDCDTESVATALASAGYASGAENHTFNEGLIPSAGRPSTASRASASRARTRSRPTAAGSATRRRNRSRTASSISSQASISSSRRRRGARRRLRPPSTPT